MPPPALTTMKAVVLSLGTVRSPWMPGSLALMTCIQRVAVARALSSQRTS